MTIPRTGLERVCQAEPLAQTDTRAPPFALQTVSLVQKASGETEVIVAGEGDLYLFAGGRVSLDKPKIPIWQGIGQRGPRTRYPLTVRFSELT